METMKNIRAARRLGGLWHAFNYTITAEFSDGKRRVVRKQTLSWNEGILLFKGGRTDAGWNSKWVNTAERTLSAAEYKALLAGETIE
jgi:hypothetical protein